MENCENFWKYFDKIDFKKRKLLIEKQEIYFFKDVNDTLKKIGVAEKKAALISNTADYIIEFILEKFKFSHFLTFFVSVFEIEHCQCTDNDAAEVTKVGNTMLQAEYTQKRLNNRKGDDSVDSPHREARRDKNPVFREQERIGS